MRHLELRPLGVEIAETYSESCQVSARVIFAKIVNGFQLLTIFVKSSIVAVWQGSDMSPNGVTTPQDPVASNNFLAS